MCVYSVCVRVLVCSCVYVHMYACLHECMFAWRHICTYIFMHIRIYDCMFVMFIYACIPIRQYLNKHLNNKYVQISKYINTYREIYINKWKDIYMYMLCYIHILFGSSPATRLGAKQMCMADFKQAVNCGHIYLYERYGKSAHT